MCVDAKRVLLTKVKEMQNLCRVTSENSHKHNTCAKEMKVFLCHPDILMENLLGEVIGTLSCVLMTTIDLGRYSEHLLPYT